MFIVIENTILGPEPRRAIVHSDALTAHEARGWVAVGETTDMYRDPIRTDVEFIAADAAERARIAALAAPKSDDGPSSRPKK